MTVVLQVAVRSASAMGSEIALIAVQSGATERLFELSVTASVGYFEIEAGKFAQFG